jgi:hypothetical protein
LILPGQAPAPVANPCSPPKTADECSTQNPGDHGLIVVFFLKVFRVNQERKQWNGRAYDQHSKAAPLTARLIRRRMAKDPFCIYMALRNSSAIPFNVLVSRPFKFLGTSRWYSCNMLSIAAVAMHSSDSGSKDLFLFLLFCSAWIKIVILI